MPTGPAFAPRAVPGWITRLRSLPQREIARRPLLGTCRTSFTLLFIGGTIAELAIFGISSDIEEHIAIGGVGESLFNQRFREIDDVLNVLSRLGHAVDLVYTE